MNRQINSQDEAAVREERSTASCFAPETMRIEYFKLERRDIQFLVFTLEGLDGPCSVETVDRSAGIVRVWTARGWETTVDRVLKALAEFGIRMIRLEKPPAHL